MIGRRRRWLAGLLLGLLAACSSRGPLSAAEYRHQVRAICRDTARATARLPVPDANDSAALVRSGRRTVALQQEALDRIRELHPPTSSRPRVEQWLGLVARTIAAAESSLRAQGEGDLAVATRANAEGSTTATRADAIARELRVGTCVTTSAG